MLEKITHEKEFIGKRMSLAKNDETKDAAKILLNDLTRLEQALKETGIEN